MEKSKEYKHIGNISTPNQEVKIENLWLVIEGERMHVNIPYNNENEYQLFSQHKDTLWGEFNSLGKVSLIECNVSMPITLNEGSYFRLSIHKLIKGFHIEHHREAFITGVALASDTLEQWIRSKWIDAKNSTIEIPEKKTLLNIKIEDFNLEIIEWYKYHRAFNDTCTINRRLFISLKFDSPKSIYDIFLLSHKLQLLLVFITNESPKLKIAAVNKIPDAIIAPEHIWQSNRFMHSIRLDYEEIKNLLPDIMEKWFSDKKIEYIYDLLLEKKGNPDLSIARYFLNMAVAIESFHRNFIKENVKVTDSRTIENREQIKKILEDHQELLIWFREKSTDWKKPTLYDRLQSLKETYQKIIGNEFKVETSKLLAKIKNARNQLAHEGITNKVFPNEFDMFIVAYSLEMLVKYLVIGELCNNDEKILKESIETAAENLSNLSSINDYNGIQNRE